MIRATAHHIDFGEEGGECPDGGRLARAALTEHQYPTYARVDRGDGQRALHIILTDNRGERISDAHVGPLLSLRGFSCDLTLKV